jgi:hypothetical protein
MYVTLNGHRARVLLDCGASSNYITRRIARQHSFTLIPKQHPYRLGLADGSHADHGMIMQETEGLSMKIEEHHDLFRRLRQFMGRGTGNIVARKMEPPGRLETQNTGIPRRRR